MQLIKLPDFDYRPSHETAAERLTPTLQHFAACDLTIGLAHTRKILPELRFSLWSGIAGLYNQDMLTLNSEMESFIIEAASQEAREPRDASYVIHLKVQGLYEVRRFLEHQGVGERNVVLAVNELGENGRVAVKAAKQR